MPKEVNGLNDWVLSHRFPTRKSSHVGSGKKPHNEGQVGRAWLNQMEM